MKSVRWMVSYILVASLGLWLAFAVSMKFMAVAHSQEAPAQVPAQAQAPASAAPQAPGSGDLPPEFMKEVEATQVPAATAATTPTAKPDEKVKVVTPPSAAQTMPQQKLPVPTGAEEKPLGDAVTAPQANVESVQGDDYVYDPTGKRDPFKPFHEMRTPVKTEKSEVPLEPLQRWEVERLQIVGILWDVKTPRAMVKDPDGGVYTVTKNSRVGRYEGYVAAIREGEIVVIETKYNDGKASKETRVMEFKK